MARSVTVQTVAGMKAEATTGPHRVIFDAPRKRGRRRRSVAGRDAAGRHRRLKALNVRRFAERRQWPMGRLEARLGATEAQGRIVAIDAELVLEGAFDDAQLAALREAAESCRISRALSVPVSLRLTVA